MSRNLTQYGLVVAVALGLLASQFFLKIGVRGGEISLASMSDVGELVRRLFTTPSLWVGYGLSALVALFWLVVLSRMDLSYAVPLLSAVYYLLLVVGSALFLREEVSGWRWLGTLAIVVGVILLSRDRP